MRLYLFIRRILAVALAFICAACSGQAIASTIVAPISAVASSEFISRGHDYFIENTFDQSGLSARYESGVDDFGTYLASKPKHTSNADGNEWFSRDFSKSGGSIAGLTITYMFEELMSINSFALWNDEFAGLGKTQLLSSEDGINYTPLMTFTPIASKFAPAGKVAPYLAQVFPFTLTDMLFFRLVIANCPGPPRRESTYRGCGIGEVAFSAEERPPPDPGEGPTAPTVPLPAAFPLLGSALGFFVWMGRRRKNYN